MVWSQTCWWSKPPARRLTLKSAVSSDRVPSFNYFERRLPTQRERSRQRRILPPAAEMHTLAFRYWRGFLLQAGTSASPARCGGASGAAASRSLAADFASGILRPAPAQRLFFHNAAVFFSPTRRLVPAQTGIPCSAGKPFLVPAIREPQAAARRAGQGWPLL